MAGAGCICKWLAPASNLTMSSGVWGGQDADGFLNKDDLKKLLGNQEDVDQLIAAADTNGDGKARACHG